VPIGVLTESSVNDDMVMDERSDIVLQSVEDEEQLNIMLAGQMPAGKIYFSVEFFQGKHVYAITVCG
jgi:hypothetical protein